MFFFTRIFRLYDVNITDFSRNLLEFIEFYKKQHEEVKIYICAIADAGTKLCEKVFSIQEDINQYNLVLEKICSSLENVFFINPYKKASEEYVLAVDGHHLNKYGNKLLFDELMKNLEEGNML